MLRRARVAMRRGFTLLEMVATIAIFSILAAATVPALVAYLTRADVQASSKFLSDVQTAVNNYLAVVTRYPFRISQLASSPSSVAPRTDSTSCSKIAPQTTGPTLLSNAQVNNWNAIGPLFYRLAGQDGIPIPIGTVRDTLFRTVNGGTAGFLQIKIVGVRTADAYELNDMVDGSAQTPSSTLGTIRFGAPTSDLVTVTWNIPVSGTC